MPDIIQNKNIKEVVEQKKTETLVAELATAKECLAAVNQLKSLEKTYGNELLRDKSIPEKWLEARKGRLALEQKLVDMNEKVLSPSCDQVLYEIVLENVIRTVLHEKLDLDIPDDISKLSSVLEEQEEPADYYEIELEKDTAFQDVLDTCTSKDVEKARNRLVYPLTHNNMSYTLKRANYKVEEVKVQSIGFLGRTLFPMLSSIEKYTQAKTPCAKGLGDWIDTPTSFVLARTNDLLQEVKGQLSLCADNKRQEEEAADRRQALLSKICRFLRVRRR